MADEGWVLAESLKALSGSCGGYRAIKGREPIEIIWQDTDASKSALGVATTRALLLGR